MDSSPRNTLGRKVYKGPRGGTYVLDAAGKKVYKFKLASGARPAAGPARANGPGRANGPARANTTRTNNAPHGRNTLGRKIYKGPRGGTYVLDASGKKVYKFKTGPPAAPARPAAPAVVRPVAEVKRPESDIQMLPPEATPVTLTIPRLIFYDNPFKVERQQVKITVDKLVNQGRLNAFGLKNRNLASLNSWTAKQAEFLQRLSVDDFLTVAAYTNRSHTWIGPFLTQKKVLDLRRVDSYHPLPLYPQLKKLLVSKNVPVGEALALSGLAPGGPKRKQYEKAYEIFCKADTSDIKRYYEYRWSELHKAISKEYLKRAMDMYARDLQSIILRSPRLDAPLHVYRGTTKNYVSNKKYTTRSFSSAAYDAKYALLYSKAGYHRMELAPGSHAIALFVLNQWNDKGEFEVLLPIGTEYIPTTANGRKLKRWIGKSVYDYVRNFAVKTP